MISHSIDVSGVLQGLKMKPVEFYVVVTNTQSNQYLWVELLEIEYKLQEDFKTTIHFSNILFKVIFFF